MEQAADYVVIGAGSAGCVLANRLSAPESGASVVLLEAGGDSRSLTYRMPLAATKLWMDPDATWGLWTQPEPALDGRRLPVPRGRALGGSSAINGTVYNRGSASDYDQWRDMGLAGWDYLSLLPYFKRIEDHWCGADRWHGDGGEVPVTRLARKSPFTQPFIEAARQMGFPATEDFCGAQTEGVGLSDLNVSRAGRRVSAYDGFIHPIRSRGSLRIESGARVRRIEITEGRATGVTFVQGGEEHHVSARREVILAAGAIASPQILLQSGIGPGAEIAAAGLTPRVESPQVGRNLSDQPGCGFEVEAALPLTFARTLRADRFAMELAKWALGMPSAAAGPPMVMVGAVRTECYPQASPDMRLTVTAATRDSRVWFPGISKGAGHKLLLSFAVAHPASRGSIKLAGPDPDAAPLINFNLLDEQEDVDRLVHYYRLLEQLISQPALQGVVGKEVQGPAPAEDAALTQHLRGMVGTTSHPLGSCRMGIDDQAVVDGRCRVNAMDGLRVVDASVFPTQISGNPHATVMMLADKIADDILGRAALPPVQPE